MLLPEPRVPFGRSVRVHTERWSRPSQGPDQRCGFPTRGHSIRVTGRYTTIGNRDLTPTGREWPRRPIPGGRSVDGTVTNVPPRRATFRAVNPGRGQVLRVVVAGADPWTSSTPNSARAAVSRSRATRAQKVAGPWWAITLVPTSGAHGVQGLLIGIDPCPGVGMVRDHADDSPEVHCGLRPRAVNALRWAPPADPRPTHTSKLGPFTELGKSRDPVVTATLSTRRHFRTMEPVSHDVGADFGYSLTALLRVWFTIDVPRSRRRRW